jgi:hypothetical protein
MRTGALFGSAMVAVLMLAGCPPDDEENGDEGEAQTYDFEVEQNADTIRAANDLHVLIAGTGGSLSNPTITEDAPDCSNTPGNASVASSGNQIDVVWDSPCVDAFETVKIRVETLFPNLQVVGVVWTLNGDTLRP